MEKFYSNTVIFSGAILIRIKLPKKENNQNIYQIYKNNLPNLNENTSKKMENNLKT